MPIIRKCNENNVSWLFPQPSSSSSGRRWASNEKSVVVSYISSTATCGGFESELSSHFPSKRKTNNSVRHSKLSLSLSPTSLAAAEFRFTIFQHFPILIVSSVELVPSSVWWFIAFDRATVACLDTEKAMNKRFSFYWTENEIIVASNWRFLVYQTLLIYESEQKRENVVQTTNFAVLLYLSSFCWTSVMVG